MSTPANSMINRRAAIKLTTGASLAASGAFPDGARAQTAELALWTGYPELVPYYKSVADDYAKQKPGVKVNILSTSLREAEQKLSAAVPTGTGPDIFDIGSTISIKFIQAGLLDQNPADIDAYLKSGAWPQWTVDFFTVNGKTYGLPILEGRAAMFYNKTMLREAGLSAPPATFKELLDAAVKMTKTDSSGRMTQAGVSMRLLGQGSGITEKFRFVLEPAGASLIVRTKDGKWRNGFDNESGRAALQFYVDVVHKYKVDDPKFVRDADAFATGKAGILFREAWVIGEIKKKNPTLDYGVAPIPRWTEGGKLTGIVQPWGIYVNGKSNNKAAAWELLKFMTTPENAFRLTSMTGWGSRRQGVDWAPLLKETPQFEAFVSPPSDQTPFIDPVIGPFDEIQSRIADRLPGLYADASLNSNPEKVAAAVKQLAGIADNILKQAGLLGQD